VLRNGTEEALLRKKIRQVFDRISELVKVTEFRGKKKPCLTRRREAAKEELNDWFKITRPSQKTADKTMISQREARVMEAPRKLLICQSREAKPYTRRDERLQKILAI
jgi:hypothetical protein